MALPALLSFEPGCSVAITAVDTTPSAATPIPHATRDNIVEVYCATDDVYVRLGDSTVAAATTDILCFAGVPRQLPIDARTHISVRAANANDNIVYVQSGSARLA